MITRTLASRPPIAGGLDLLRVVESSSRKIAKTVEPREAFLILRDLLQIARADGMVTDTERLVLRAACVGLGLRGQVDVQVHDGKTRLKRVRAT